MHRLFLPLLLLCLLTPVARAQISLPDGLRLEASIGGLASTQQYWKGTNTNYLHLELTVPLQVGTNFTLAPGVLYLEGVGPTYEVDAQEVVPGSFAGQGTVGFSPNDALGFGFKMRHDLVARRVGFYTLTRIYLVNNRMGQKGSLVSFGLGGSVRVTESLTIGLEAQGGSLAGLEDALVGGFGVSLRRRVN